MNPFTQIRQVKMIRNLRAYLIAGILVITPLALTTYIFWNLFIGLDGILLGGFNNITTLLGLPAYESKIPGLGIVVMLILTVLVGMFTKILIGRKLFRIGEWFLTRIPFISKIYIAISQIFKALFAEKREVFKHVVLFEYPRRGMYSIGFMTQDTRGEIQDILEEDVYSIFLPTTPNPTSGYLLFVPKKDATILSMRVEEALKLIISGGAITPSPFSEKEISLEDLLPLRKKRLKKRKKAEHADSSTSET